MEDTFCEKGNKDIKRGRSMRFKKAIYEYKGYEVRLEFLESEEVYNEDFGVLFEIWKGGHVYFSGIGNSRAEAKQESRMEIDKLVAKRSKEEAVRLLEDVVRSIKGGASVEGTMEYLPGGKTKIEIEVLL